MNMENNELNLENQGLENQSAGALDNGHDNSFSEPGGSADETGGKNLPDKSVQSDKDNRRFADMRRRHENRELKARMEQFAKSKGYSSFAEMERVSSEREEAEYKSQFEEGTGIGYDLVQEAIKREINNHPDVIAARNMLKQNEDNNIEKAFLKDLKKISEISGIEINEAADLRNLPNFEEFDSLARQGVGILNAFKVSHTDLLIQNAEKKAAQKTLNQISSKGHLTSTKGGAGGSEVIVPEDIKEQYRIFNPGITDEEILKDYAKAMKRNG